MTKGGKFSYPLRPLGNWLLDKVVGAKGALAAGHSFARKGKFAVAAEAFEDAERLYAEQLGRSHPRVAEVIAYRAWCYAKSGRAADAVALYEEAIELERGHVDGERALQLVEQLAWARSLIR